ncbi:MAG TPA: FAD-dependent oxidoreductase, partial [Polyangiales bacterium]|nr:FAD-dependent oxidoreductase [Polyangiales bacterium]
MARTSAFSALRRGIRLALDAERRGIPLHASLEHREQLAAAYAAHEVRRRDFVRGASAALASSYLLSGCATEDHASDLHVGVVGAGMAGLLCAYRLKQAGVRVTVFEGSTRAGGRMYTARSKLPGSAVIELGGELIDTGHATLRRVARELGVAIDEVTDYPKDVRADTYFVGGKRVLEAVLADAFRPLAARMQSDLKAADKSDDAFAKLDAQSIAEWLDAMPDLDPTLKKVLSVAYVGEYGRELDEQSVFNLLWLIDSRTPEPFRIFGDSDERSHIHLGSDTIPTLLAKKLDAELRYEQRLVRVDKLSDGRIRLTLDHGGKSSEQTFDKVVLAIPFTMLRSVEHSTGLFGDKQTIIDELGYGTNAKL